MRVHCPNRNCPIDVPDDFAGAKIRCPQCGHLFIVEAGQRDPLAEQIQATAPKPTVKKTPALENQIYDGLPPLSLMIALRRQRAGIDPGDIHQFEMTDDDWKALAAFEKVLRAGVSLRTSLLVLAVTLGLNLLVGAMDFSQPHGSRGENALGSLGIAGTLAACWGLILSGSKSLAKIRRDLVVDVLFWAIVAAILILGFVTTMRVLPLKGQSDGNGYSLVMLASIVANGIAMFDLVWTGIRVWRALSEIEPPEITSRLVEALSFLE